MKLLAVDTALGACSCAVIDDARVLAHCFEIMDRGHAERLAPMVEEAMREARLSFAELERLAVTTGPGTFTGQRVGLAFARGLRVALRLPLIGVTTLEAMASAAMAETGLPLAVAIHDAKRGEVYFSLHRGDDALISPTVLSFDSAIAEIAKAAGASPIAFAGTATEAAVQAYGEKAQATGIRLPDALWVGRLAFKREPAAEAPSPLYLRPPDAKLPGQK